MLRERERAFALVTSDHRIHLKADDETRPDFEDAGAERFRTMPYWEVPADVIEDRERFEEWARRAIEVGHRTAAPKRRRRTR